jgi:hypothetical protein
MNTMLRNFVLGAALAAAAGNASAATMTVYETPAGSELVSSLDAGAGTYQVVYSLNICPLTSGDILVVTSESQIQNSSLTDDIYVAASSGATRRRARPGARSPARATARTSRRTITASSPKVSISTITADTGECVINYIARAAGDPGDTVDVANNRGRLQVLKISQ